MRRIIAGLLLTSAVLFSSVNARGDTVAERVYRSASPYVVSISASGPTGVISGSGVILKRFDEYESVVVTNSHVVSGATRITVSQGGTRWAARIYRSFTGSQLDVAFLFIRSTRHGPPVAQSEPLIGADVFAIGSPQGIESSLSRGIVSGIRRNAAGVHVIQTDAAISPGSSGGGLFSADSELLGITSFKVQERAGSVRTEGLNFAISVEDLGLLLLASRNATIVENVMRSARPDLIEVVAPYSGPMRTALERGFPTYSPEVVATFESPVFPIWLLLQDQQQNNRLDKILSQAQMLYSSNFFDTASLAGKGDDARRMVGLYLAWVMETTHDWLESDFYKNPAALR